MVPCPRRTKRHISREMIEWDEENETGELEANAPGWSMVENLKEGSNYGIKLGVLSARMYVVKLTATPTKQVKQVSLS